MHRAVTVTRSRSSVPGAAGRRAVRYSSTASAKSASTCRMCRTIRTGIEFPGPQLGDLRHRRGVVGRGEDRGVHGVDQRFVRRAIGQRRAEPLQPRVVVGEQQIVLGGEVPVEGAQRHSGVGGDLLGGRVLHALREEADQRGLAQRLARAFAARRLRRSDHVGKVPQARPRRPTDGSVHNLDYANSSTRPGPSIGPTGDRVAKAFVESTEARSVEFEVIAGQRRSQMLYIRARFQQ